MRSVHQGSWHNPCRFVFCVGQMSRSKALRFNDDMNVIISCGLCGTS